MKFTKPDEKTLARMTVRSLTALLESLREQRAKVVKPYDTQIEFYEKLLEQKKGASDAETTSRV